MPSLDSDEEDLTTLPAPTSINPYSVLNLDKTATDTQIKSSYRKLALQHHPDKASPSNASSAKEKFQEIAFAYAILSDPRRRSRYDLTGRTEESLTLDGAEDEDGEFNWSDFYRTQFEDVISAESIEVFKKEYQGSGEERAAVLEAYTEGEGDMDFVFENVMCSEVEADEGRFRGLIEEAIKEGEVQAFDKFTGESKRSKEGRRKRAREEAKEAEEMAEEMGVKEKLFGGKGKKVKGEDGLKALIMQRQKGRQEDFLAGLEAKYAAKPKGKGKAGKGQGKKEVTEEPPEEMFERNRARKGDSDKEAAGSRRSKRVKT
ncbi:DnaJ domain-containing protein 7 [Elsinoe australis]|uniref:DnaJ domain-containing protein 7 n=1 Tax=Elsinoe australis TaxID=40998 RepID=A0A4U7AYE1_9PEZI|nr:DnaJ domain-containing protein 7 [Elsinoe australis]